MKGYENRANPGGVTSNPISKNGNKSPCPPVEEELTGTNKTMIKTFQTIKSVKKICGVWQ